MKYYEISQEFVALKDFVLQLPGVFQTTGTLIHGRRNILRKVSIPEGDFMVKNFKAMYFISRIVFSIFRISKAERSYRHAEILKRNGFTTPANVAWLDRYSMGLLIESFYISEFCTWKTFHETMTSFGEDKEQKENLIKHLAQFAFRLHEAGIYHLDFSTGNILIIPPLHSYHFALVDLNRMKFGKFNYNALLKNFVRLDLQVEDMNMLIREYAILSGKHPEESIRIYWNSKERISSFRRFRKRVRQYTLTPIERGIARISKSQ